MNKTITNRMFSYILIVLGLVGVLASIILSYEKYQVALDPQHTPSCSLNPIVACESVLASGTDALLFNIPNSFLGIGMFAALVTVGAMMLSGAKLRDRFWKLFYVVVMFGVGLSVFFFTQSLYVIGSLCLYCMTTWLVVLALFVYSTIWLVQEKILTPPKMIKKYWPTISANHLGVFIIIALIMYTLIGLRFEDPFWGRYIWQIWFE